MHWNEIALALSPLAALIVAVWAVIRERRKPQLDEAQIDQVKNEIKRTNEEFNLRRDRRILDLENWGDNMRPWASAMMRRDDVMCNLIKEDRTRLGLPMPDIEPLPPMPEFPKPQPLT